MDDDPDDKDDSKRQDWEYSDVLLPDKTYPL